MSKRNDAKTKSFVDKIDNTIIYYFSSSLKFCKLVEGKANIYPRLHSISKWDIAAGDAILRAAGGILLNGDGKIFFYNTKTSKTGVFFALSSIALWEKSIKPCLSEFKNSCYDIK